jgi:hypothetical protein
MSNVTGVFEFRLAYGWAADPIKDQIEAFGPTDVDPDMIEHWQKDADAILRCAMRSLIPDGQIMKARNKLAREVEKYLVEKGHFILAEADQ